MRVQGFVEVQHRGLGSKTKIAHSSIAIGIKSKNESLDDVYLIISTAQNLNGNKYLIRNFEAINLSKIFDRFASTGKACLQLLSPPVDILLSKLDPIQLKGFLSILKSVISAKNRAEIDNLKLSSAPLKVPATKKQVTKPQTKIIVTERKDYPLTSGFPESLEFLQANNISLKRFDIRILSLRRLVHLNLSNNALKDISVLANVDRNRLESLRELLLSGNQIERVPEHFCENPTFRKQLSVLHLSENRLKSLPNNIYKLSSIRELVLNNNPEFQFLPHTIGQVAQSLRVFSAMACPNLKWYPESIASWRLSSLHLSPEPLQLSEAPHEALVDTLINVPSLFDFCSLRVLPMVPILTRKDVPATVLAALETIPKCTCKKPIYRSSHLFAPSSIPISSRAEVISVVPTDYSRDIRTMGFFCSRKCFKILT